MSGRLTLAFIVLVLGPAHMALPQAANDKQLVTLTGDPWPPYIIGELGKEAESGVGIELVYAIFSRVDGIELHIPLVPWNRALREVERGDKDGIAILLKTPEREAYMDYTDEVFRSHSTIWYSTSNFPQGFDWQNPDDFKRYRIGGVRGHSYGEELDRMTADGSLAVVEVSSARQLFAMLAKGRIQLAIADRLVGASFADEYVDSDQRLLSVKKPLAGEVYHIAFSKKSETRHLIPVLNRVIAELKHEGVVQRLISDTCTVAGHTPDN
jgi:ABC-type amino acid transport substrate-binding protein